MPKELVPKKISITKFILLSTKQITVKQYKKGFQLRGIFIL